MLREELSEDLRGVLDVERLLGRLAMGQGVPRDLAGLRASLRRMPELAGRLSRCGSALLQSLAPPLLALRELTSLLERALADEVPAGRFEPGFVRPGFHSGLDELAELAHGGRAAIAAMEAAERARTGIASLKVRYNRIFGFYIEVTKPNLHLVPADYQRKSSTVGAERFVTPALAEHESRVLSAEERAGGGRAADLRRDSRGRARAQPGPARLRRSRRAGRRAPLVCARGVGVGLGAAGGR